MCPIEPDEQYELMGCGCKFCEDCIKGQMQQCLSNSIASATYRDPVGCVSCREPMVIKDIKRLFNSEERSILASNVFHDYIRKYGARYNIQKCPSINCPQYVRGFQMLLHSAVIVVIT
eukprot:UN14351